MKKITELTEAQEKRLVDLREEWLRIGYSTAPLDRKVCTEIIGEFYSRIGQPKPLVLFFSSPMMCILAWGVLKSLLKKNKTGEPVRAQLGAQLRAQLGDQLRDQLWAQLRDQLWAQLGAQLGDQLRDQLRDQLGAQLNHYFAGAQWCNWEVFYKFGLEIGVEHTVEQEELLDLWLYQSRHLHWWFPYKGIALASERHTRVKVDSQHRLHSDDGPACGYSDGWGIWAWHGVRVPQEIIEHPEKITAKVILSEQNAELRRIMIDRVGMERFITESGAKQIHSHERGILYEIGLPNDPEGVLKAVEVICPSTSRRYFLRVPPQITRADDGVAWSFGFEVTKDYKPILET